MLPQDVRPGDLITAQLISEMLAKLRELDKRVTDLQAAAQQEGPPTSLRLSSEGALHPGDWTILLGQSLGGGKKAVQIRFDNTLVSEYDATLLTDAAVRFRVPSINLDQSPKAMTLYVTNGRGEGQLAVQLEKLVTPLPRSAIDVGYRSADPATLVVGQTASFLFDLTLLSAQRVELGLRASLVKAGAAPVDLPIPSLTQGKLAINGPGAATVAARAAVLPAPPFKVVLTIEAPGLQSFTAEKDITVLDEKVDPNIALGTASAKVRRPGLPPLPIQEVSDTGEACSIQIPTSKTAIVTVIATLASPVVPAVDTVYRWTLTAVSGDTAKWSLSATSSGDHKVNAAEFVNGVAVWEIAPEITPQAGAGAATWSLDVLRVGETDGKKKSKRLLLSVKP